MGLRAVRNCMRLTMLAAQQQLGVAGHGLRSAAGRGTWSTCLLALTAPVRCSWTARGSQPKASPLARSAQETSL